MTEMEERVARAIIESIRGNRQYLCDIDEPENGVVLINGGVDMLLAARAAIAAVRAKAADDPDNNIPQAGFEAMFVEKWDGTQAPMMGAALDAMLDAILGPPSAAADVLGGK